MTVDCDKLDIIIDLLNVVDHNIVLIKKNLLELLNKNDIKEDYINEKISLWKMNNSK